MSILIAYIIIGLTFSASFVATHKHVSSDSLADYVFGITAVTAVWPLTIWVSVREKYRKLYF